MQIIDIIILNIRKTMKIDLLFMNILFKLTTYEYTLGERKYSLFIEAVNWYAKTSFIMKIAESYAMNLN